MSQTHFGSYHYYELEERGEESKWLGIYLKHKRAVEWLGKQLSDDE